MVLTLGGIRLLCGLISLTLVGSVHFVNRVDPWWDPSTLWTYKFDPGWVRPLLSLTLGGIHPLCGLISLTLVRSVHFVNRVDPWWDPSTLW